MVPDQGTAPGPTVRLPLSAAQRGVWMAHDLDPSGLGYNVGEYREIRGTLDPDLFAACWRQLAREADSLRVRAVVQDDDGMGQLLAAEPDPAGLRLVDVTDADDPVAAARRHAERVVAEPFDPTTGPLSRHALVKAADDLWFYCKGYHHLVVDGHSVQALDTRLGELYERAAAGEPWGPSPFGALADVLAEDEAYRASPEADEDRAFWAARCADLPEPYRLAEGRTHLPPRDDASAALPFVRRTVLLPPDDADRLKATARAHRAPWSMLVIALIAGYLHRVGGHGELVLGLPVTARTTPLSRSTPCMASTIVPVRVAVPRGLTAAGLTASVVSEVKAALRHQRTRYEEICPAGGPSGDRRGIAAPLVNIMAFAPGQTFAGRPTVLHNVSNGPVEDLAVAVYDLGPDTGLRIDFDASPDVCDTDAVADHQDRFLRFAETALTAMERPLQDIDLLDPVERRVVLGEWSGVGGEVEDLALGALVERQARSRPGAPAVVSGEETVSYGELNAAANRLARHLIASGAGRGDLVGVLLDRGAEFAVAVLAVVKSGAAYVLLDPEFPDERLRSTALDAAVRVLVTDSAHARRIDGPWTTVRVDADRAAIAARPPADPPAVNTGGDVACVMFTSGSTGRPKGILSSHRALVSTVSGQSYAGFGAGEVFLQCSPVSWDAFSLEFWGALVHGGVTVLQPGQRPEPLLVAELAARHGVTMLQVSSSLFNHLTDEHPEAFASVRVAFTGGEPASAAHARRLHARYPGLRIVNGYGPAESLGFTTTHVLGAEVDVRVPVPIGRPLVNKYAFVLDRYLRPVAPGTVGDLYLAGHGLAYGYLGQPGVSASHFVPHPYGKPGERVYRTGDRARFDAEGVLHYHGRADGQVKIRGFRVEPAEIETALLSLPGVDRAAVTARPDQHGHPQLVAHLALTAGAPATARDIRDWLGARLPDHMVPSHVVVLDHLPLTPNGKIDQRALPAPTVTATGGRAPRTPLEEILCELFAETLSATGPLTIDDDFYDLGGHSLLAARLATRVGAAVGRRLTIRDVFLSPTPAALAERITDSLGVRPLPAPTAGAGASDGPPPLSYAQRRLWLVTDLEPGGISYNVPMSVRLEGELDPDALRAAFADVVARHEPLRTVFPVRDGEPYQRVLPADPSTLRFERRPATATDVDAHLAAEAARPFDPATEPPLRVTLFELDRRTSVLLVLMHHIATDGQSLRPLLSDLATAYAARRRGTAPDWEPLPLRYADFARWQRHALGEASDPDSPLAAELAYWRTALAGLPEELGLTPDRPRPAVAGHRGGAVPVDFGPDLLGRITELARTERCTPFMVVHAALAATLAGLGAGDDIPVGVPVAGRPDESLSGLVGFFVNTVVLRTDTSGRPTFRDLLERVRRTDLEAFAHQEAPFDLVLEAVNPERSLSRHPLFQVCLTLEDAAEATLALPGLRPAAAVAVPNGSAKFDLEFLLRSDPERGLTGTVLHDADLYDTDTVARMVTLLGRTLELAAARPGTPVADLDLLDPVERRVVLGEWSGVGGEVEDLALGALVERQARSRPGAPAVVSGEVTVSYGELNAAANRLARHLIASGAGRGDLVGVLLDRGVEFAVAVLAVVKSGAAYVLLDPEFPDERLSATAAGAGIGVLVTDAAHAHRISGPWTTVRTDTDRHLVDAHPGTDPAVPLFGGDVACVMFTSGSTGRPKGILSSHRALVSTVSGQSYADFGAGEVFLQCSPVSWDAFSLEFWGALVHGGVTVLQPGQRPEPLLVAELAARHGVTMLQVSSSLFNHLTDEHPEAFASVRVAFTGGEPASAAHACRLHARYPGLRIVNGYGPAESLGFTTTHVLGVEVDVRVPVPIGRPLVNKYAFVLDRYLRPVAPGTVGDLYLAGHGLAYGYLGQPGVSAAHFVPHPYGVPGERLYRTGDRARFDAEGVLHYHGRADGQVKIRGFRVEPAEIETALLSLPGVVQAAAVVREDTPGVGKRLVAYVVPGPGSALDPVGVRRALALSLPDHMVPSHVVLLDRLPLTPNGKIDQRALPAPTVTATGGRAPRTPLEATLCTLFTDVLKTPHQVPADSDFFDHGGHSLLAARLTSRISSALGVRLTTRDVFQHSTPAALAAHLDLLAATASAPARPRPALRRRVPTS